MSFVRRIHLLTVIALILLAAAANAQEPVPSNIRWEGIARGDDVGLVLAWRFHPGNDARFSSPTFDDRGWEVVEPRMPPTSRPRGGWPGEGWFRRHVAADEAIRSREIVLQIEAPGRTWVYLDGVLVMQSGGDERAARAGGRDHRFAASTRISLGGGEHHVFAVHYACDCAGNGDIGFELTLQRVEALETRNATLRRDATIYGAFIAIPAVLGLLHLALFIWYRKARENLFCALCMLSLSTIIATSFAQQILQSQLALGLALTAMFAGIVGATLFGLLTYTVARSGTAPRSWIAFAVAGALVVAIAPFLGNTGQNVAWAGYFLASLVEIVRFEMKAPKLRPGAGYTLLAGMLLLDAGIVAQIFISFGVVDPPFRFDSVYLVGVLAFSVATSLFVARSFAQTSIDLERRLDEVQTLSEQVIQAERESARRGLEIEAARTLQRSILPASVPQFERMELAATVTTASEVGGDYYDFRSSGPESVIVALGDAAGHGVAAGAMVTATKALFSSMAGVEDLPAILGQCDRVLRSMNVRPLHMCLLLARITPESVTVCSAAMPRPLLYSAAKKTVEEIAVSGLPLAVSLESQWEELSVAIGSGDVLLLASDGLAEALSPAGEPLGYERVAQRFAAVAERGSAEAVNDFLLAEAASWRGTRAQDDDIAIVTVCIR